MFLESTTNLISFFLPPVSIFYTRIVPAASLAEVWGKCKLTKKWWWLNIAKFICDCQFLISLSLFYFIFFSAFTFYSLCPPFIFFIGRQISTNRAGVPGLTNPSHSHEKEVSDGPLRARMPIDTQLGSHECHEVASTEPALRIPNATCRVWWALCQSRSRSKILCSSLLSFHQIQHRLAMNVLYNPLVRLIQTLFDKSTRCLGGLNPVGFPPLLKPAFLSRGVIPWVIPYSTVALVTYVPYLHPPKVLYRTHNTIFSFRFPSARRSTHVECHGTLYWYQRM